MASQMVPLRVIKPPTTREWLKLLLWIPVAVFVTDNVVGVVSVEGASMCPTLNPDWPKHTTRDWILLDKWHVAWRKPWHRGDIVTLWSPTSNSKRLTVKRVIGVEGDTIETLHPYPRKFVTLEPGQVWVEGDNPAMSKDSNSYGPVPIGLIHSRAARVWYPYNKSLSPPQPTERVVLPSSSDPNPVQPPSPAPTWAQAARVFVPGAHSPKKGRMPGSGGVGWGGPDGMGEGETPEHEAERLAKKNARKLV
ncbi:peptidase S24/S26A/S26B/S26C [Mrakia frigida]|uniref:endopeptidase catalytic subunit n=1 Tax=Mrakia frigida TaxID=29902 RepID=UPI003FCBFF23